MTHTTLFRVEGTTADLLSNWFSEPLCELVRAGSPAEAARIAVRFWSGALKGSVSVDCLTVQRLHEPLGGTGLVYEAALREDRFMLEHGELIPVEQHSPTLLERMLLAVSA
ncbi:MAG: hypothetical protein DWQ34_27030 [Planctomycetota bacterium]|nr:MAG: hypothetical protein DWQ34_27030 [Planctomycetota bacterium]REK28452.1 MAG: hypothetical protein DWQ41_05740 [Planctomycetota bacterium]REK29129.1 MAG: hypothetical protein DWQ45_23595 [Planctomycetota bacterium]